jgi:anti-sigma factor RsiW
MSSEVTRPPHVDEAALTAWIDGVLDDAAAAALEAHVMSCPVCASALQAVARVDAAMFEAAEVMHPIPSVARPRRRAIAGQSLALAAALVLGLGLPGRWLSFASGEPVPETIGVQASLDASLLRSAPPSCPVLDDPSAELCDGPEDPSPLEGALAMTMPDPIEDVPGLCEDDGSLVCDVETIAG